MIKFILRRIAVAIPTLFVLSVVTFFLMHAAPGGPFNSERPLPASVMANINAKYGLDQPLWHQLFTYLKGVVTEFDFGPSYKFKDRTVNDIIAQGFPVTLTYGFWAFLVATTVGISLGVAAAVRHNTVLDYFAVGISIGAQVLPNFVMAPLLVWLFTLGLGWLPGGGWDGGGFKNLVMPVIALSTSYMASARAKGLPNRKIIFSHALKPALLPVVSYLGPAFVGMVTGSVVIDTFFSTGGIGQAFVNSAFSRDYSVMMGITILVGTLTIAFNMLVDILYAWIDPKVRL